MGDTGEELPELRVGDTERRAATQALDTHLAAGRLSAEEYGDRYAAATLAVHSSDLSNLFRDLPAPHPTLPRRPGERVEPMSPSEVYSRPVRDEHVPERAALDAPGPASFGLVMVLAVAIPGLVVLSIAMSGAGGALLFLPLLFLLAASAGRHGGGRD